MTHIEPRSSRTFPGICTASWSLAPLAAALLAAGCAVAPAVPTEVAMTGMPSAELALRDSMRVVDAEMGKLGVMVSAPQRRAAGPVVPGELQRLGASGSVDPSLPLRRALRLER